MRRFVGVLLGIAGALVLVNPVACGGRVGEIGGGGGGDGGGFCPAPSSVQEGAECAPSGETCSSAYPSCGDGVLPCTCSGGIWVCEPAPPCPPPPPSCPAPASITSGGTCTTDPGLNCTSTIPIYDDCTGAFDGYLPCNCSDGTWLCFISEPACVDASPPPSSCPAPSSVEQGLPCAGSPSQCPGNPTDCGGAIFYDAFECQDGAWNDVAHTDCAVEAGVLDAGVGAD